MPCWNLFRNFLKKKSIVSSKCSIEWYFIKLIKAFIYFLIGCIILCRMGVKDNKIIITAGSIAGGIKTFTAVGTGALGITALLKNSVEYLTVSTNHKWSSWKWLRVWWYLLYYFLSYQFVALLFSHIIYAHQLNFLENTHALKVIQASSNNTKVILASFVWIIRYDLRSLIMMRTYISYWWQHLPVGVSNSRTRLYVVVFYFRHDSYEWCMAVCLQHYYRWDFNHPEAKSLNDLEIASIELLIDRLNNMVEEAGTKFGQEFRDFMCDFNGRFFDLSFYKNLF